jgi:hypothetical protein
MRTGAVELAEGVGAVDILDERNVVLLGQIAVAGGEAGAANIQLSGNSDGQRLAVLVHDVNSRVEDGLTDWRRAMQTNKQTRQRADELKGRNIKTEERAELQNSLGMV